MLIADNKPTGELVPFCQNQKKEFLSVKRLGHVFVISRAMFSKNRLLSSLGDRAKNKGRKEQLRNST